MRRSLWAFVASVVLLAAFLGVVGPRALAGHLAGANLAVFSLGLLAMVATLLCWSEGLRLLLVDAGGQVSVWRTAVAYTAAMLGRNLIPMGAVASPAITAYAVDREVSLSYNETLAVVTVAEFLGTIASLLVVAIGIPSLLIASPGVPQFRLFILAIAGLAAVLLVTTVVFWYRRRTIEYAVLGVTHFLQVTVGRIGARLHAALAPDRVEDQLHRFYATVETLAANRRTVALSFALHLLGWIASTLPLYTSALAVDVHVPLALVFFLVPASQLATALPLPGGLGGVEVVLAGALAVVLGIDVALAATIALLYRLCAYWFLLVAGAVASLYAAASVRSLADVS
jgi:uncharacterized protein (TIRG00374 family)